MEIAETTKYETINLNGGVHYLMREKSRNYSKTILGLAVSSNSQILLTLTN